ncbi:methionyl-tRNA formyltransferase, partial [Mycobacterium kansasii]
HVGTATAPLRLGTVQPPGKKPMPAADWARGARVESGTILGGDQ